jgi:hypothetical protein
MIVRRIRVAVPCIYNRAGYIDERQAWLVNQIYDLHVSLMIITDLEKQTILAQMN